MFLEDVQTERELATSMPDEELLARGSNQPALFEQLIDRYAEPFLRKAFSILRNKEAAEDAVQDAFVKMFKNARRFQPTPGAGFKSWGYRILVNTCFTAYQKRKREGVFLADLDPEFQELVADRGVQKSNEERLDTDEVASLLDKLPPSLSGVMRLHFVEGKPHAEVARMVGISEGAVRARVHRAKHELRSLIKAREEKKHYG